MCLFFRYESKCYEKIVARLGCFTRCQNITELWAICLSSDSWCVFNFETKFQEQNNVLTHSHPQGTVIDTIFMNCSRYGNALPITSAAFFICKKSLECQPRLLASPNRTAHGYQLLIYNGQKLQRNHVK